MEEIYLAIAELLHDKVPEIDHIDEDTGQLYPVQYDDRYEYPVLFPCVLIDASTVDWKAEHQTDSQRGAMTVTVKLAFKCDEDTHFSSIEHGNDFSQLKQRHRINKEMIKAMHGHCLIKNASDMRRSQSRNYSIPGRVKVYETTFLMNISEDLQVSE